ncbi:Hpt domain-containing protein [Polaromonas sp. P1-6]|nr:Hpt domain-containing protein [Polaromonas sp. P1-6]
MDTQEDKFLQQLRATFKVEAEEHVQAIAAGLLALERPPSAKAQSQIVETVFRAAHSLKGAARAVDFTEIELLCQSLEDVFVNWKRLDGVPSADALDALHRVLNAATLTLAAPAGPAAQPALSLLRQALRPFASASSSAHQKSAAADPSAHAHFPAAAVSPAIEAVAPVLSVATGKMPPQETVRVAVSKLEARLLEAEELLTAKLTADQRVADLRELSGRFDAWRNAWAEVEPEARQLRQQSDQPAMLAQRHSSAGWPGCWTSLIGAWTTSKQWKARQWPWSGRRSMTAMPLANWWTICWRIRSNCSCCRLPRFRHRSRNWCATCAAIKARRLTW